MEITNRKFGIRTGIGTTTGKKTASETSTGTIKGVQRQGKERHGSYRDRDSESCISRDRERETGAVIRTGTAEIL